MVGFLAMTRQNEKGDHSEDGTRWFRDEHDATALLPLDVDFDAKRIFIAERQGEIEGVASSGGAGSVEADECSGEGKGCILERGNLDGEGDPERGFKNGAQRVEKIAAAIERAGGDVEKPWRGIGEDAARTEDRSGRVTELSAEERARECGGHCGRNNSEIDGGGDRNGDRAHEVEIPDRGRALVDETERSAVLKDGVKGSGVEGDFRSDGEIGTTLRVWNGELVDGGRTGGERVGHDDGGALDVQ